MTSVGIVGLGAVVRNIHMPAYAGMKDAVRIAAGCDPREEAREFAAKKWGIPVYESAEEMLEKARPDVAAICTPPHLHRAQVEMALNAGCHVFCEKPVAESLADAGAMIAASERAGKIVVVNNQFPYMRIHAAAKRAIGTPEFGELLHLSVWHTMRTDGATEAGWRGELRRRLGFEFGVHVFELVRYFFEAEPVRMMAHMPNPRRGAHCDSVNTIAMEFADGRGVSIVLDRLSRGPERYLDMRLDGERAAVHTSIGGQVRLSLGMHTRERRPFADFRFVKGGLAVLQDGNRSRVIAKDGMRPFADATAVHFRAFLEALRTGGQAPGDIRDNRKTLALTMAAYESAERREWVACPVFPS